MAKILILGGGFGGVVAAERLAEQLSDEHQITLVSRSRSFIFYPALVRLAFGKCDVSDVSFDLRRAMLPRRINFIEADIAHFDPGFHRVTIARGDVEGKLPYDYLIFALGRRFATECVPGFYEYAHHLLNVDKAIQFGKAVSTFHQGHAVIGQCKDARLPVPVFETAFALARLLEERGERDQVKITVALPGDVEAELGAATGSSVAKALAAHEIEVRNCFPIERVGDHTVTTSQGANLNFDLLMLVPTMRGSSAARYLGQTDAEGYIRVDRTMRVNGYQNIYAVGDCVNFEGPKMGHMAVRQGVVAAANLAAQIQGHPPVSQYSHEMRLVIEDSAGSFYLHKDIWSQDPGESKQGRFWSWAKRVQERYWEFSHS